jgi:phosphoribosylanthranilate isomerase
MSGESLVAGIEPRERPAIKFCGMTRPEDATLAAELGAGYVGVIFAESPRKVSEEIARSVFEAAGPGTRHVAVFGSQSPTTAAAIATRIGADIIQLHAKPEQNDLETLRREFDGEIWAVISLDPEEGGLPRSAFDLADKADGILLDARVGGKTGGTGRTLRWDELRGDAVRLAERGPVILAGGLRPENVGEAVRVLNPMVVDVSSGVESSPGVKDHSRMRAFAQAVASASIVG